jgi:hypothetical protein
MIRRSKRIQLIQCRNLSCPHSPWTRLPAEILDLIFVFVRRKKSLSNCALACKFWLPLVRRRLLKALTIRRGIDQFFGILSLPSSLFPQYVTTLQIVGGTSNYTTLEKGMVSAIVRLQRLRSLKLCNLVIGYNVADEFCSLKKISSLEAVEIQGGTFSTLSQYLEMLCYESPLG